MNVHSNIMENSKKEDIIIELGDEWLRVGLVGDKVPRKCIRNKGYLRYSSTQATKYEVALQELLYNIFYSYINCSCAGKTVILLEKVFTDRRVLQAMARIMFTKLKIDRIEFALSCVTPLYLTGRYSGLVVVAGATCVELMAVFEGYPLMREYRCLEVGTLKFNKIIRDELAHINKEMSMDNLRTITDEEITDHIRNPLSSANPSNQMVAVNIRKLRLKFIPDRINYNIFFGDAEQQEPNIAHSFCSLLNALPPTTIQAVSNNVVLAGGLWRVKGMQKYFKKQVSEHINSFPKLANLKVRQQLGFVSWSFNPSDIPWIGCSIGAAIRSVDHLTLKNSEFQEHGFSEKIMKTYFLSG